MKIIKYNLAQIYKDYDLEFKGGLSIAMGNFDGLHIGHKSVINLAKPKNSRVKFGVLTFEPHPREFFQPNTNNFRLMNRHTKNIELKKLGLDVVIEIPFDKSLSLLNPEEFVSIILKQHLSINHIVVGSNFHFGYKRSGNTKLLKNLGEKYDFSVTCAPIKKVDGLDISSTAIREALSNGQMELASKMLGNWYSITGTVLEGDKRGHGLGFPTINLSVKGLHLPKYGVYSALVNVLSGKHVGLYQAAVSIGERPTFGQNIPNLEAHLLDFSGNLYGQDVSISLIKFQRPEKQFETTKKLIEQMQEDCSYTRKILLDHN